MNKFILVIVVCIANTKDDLKAKATEALQQGEKVKVC